MRIIPVLDIKEGVVVRGIAGRRSEYRPIQSTLTRSADPIQVAESLQDSFQTDQFYLADIDALEGAPPQSEIYQQLADRRIHLWVDAGITDEYQLQSFDIPAVEAWVVGLETLHSADSLKRMIDRFSIGRIVFSLDMKDRRPLARSQYWVGKSIDEIGDTILALGIQQFIILDLSSVGTYAGWGGAAALTRWAKQHSSVKFYVAGGVRHLADLQNALESGAAGALIASALHDGKITPLQIEKLRKQCPFDSPAPDPTSLPNQPEHLADTKRSKE
jgi:phosphoribosylformimino-5-aminoimidazole carboxamide ribotide isomerase